MSLKQRRPAGSVPHEHREPANRSAADHRGTPSSSIDSSERVAAQRRSIEAAFGPVFQRETDAVENRTGMPDALKSGIEAMSGMDLSDVRVHTNSSKPAQLNALAYAQGNEIHLGPGQEQHLAHEAWHVVQQRQGRVQPTTQLQGTAINDDSSLEREADVMGERAAAAPGPALQMRGKRREPGPKPTGLTRKQVQAIDNRAWEIALEATKDKRPQGQRATKVNEGTSDDTDAVTRVTGANLGVLTVTYYQDNDTLSQENESTRLGQMTALFNHELAYHGSAAVVAGMQHGTDDPDDEHFSMFDPRRREDLAETSIAALDAITDLKAQLEYIAWWEKDIKTHIGWDDEIRPRDRKEARAWAEKTASAMRLRVKAAHEGDAAQRMVVQRTPFSHGPAWLETTDYGVQGTDKVDGLHDILAAMLEAGALRDIQSLEDALKSDAESEDEETAGWYEENERDIKILLDQIASAKEALLSRREGPGGKGDDEKKASLFVVMDKAKLNEKISASVAKSMHEGKQTYLPRWLSYVKGRHNPDLAILGSSQVFVSLDLIGSDEEAEAAAETVGRLVIRDKKGNYYGLVCDV